MAKRAKKLAPKRNQTGRRFRPLRFVLRFAFRVLGIGFALMALWVLAYSVINPPATWYILQEQRRLGEVDRIWVPLDEVAPVMARSVVAAEDANFCTHWGFDVDAIRLAIAEGGSRGASTLTQQVVKNVFLWHGRSWVRKAMEALITPMVEAMWSKRRIIEVYLNVAEFDEGVFGIEAASRHYFGANPAKLSAVQAARLAAVLPGPKHRSASAPSASLRRRAGAIRDGAATIKADGRAGCFEQ